MLAGVAAGSFADLAEAAAQSVKLAPEPIRPRPAHRRGLRATRYRAYRRLFDGVEGSLA